MRKINKKSASLVALQLSTTLSPLTVLTQASADTVSDTVTKAKQSGVDVKVEDNGVIKVSSQQEADAKNAEAEVQLKADALKASQVIDEYIAEKSEVQKANQDAQTRYEAEVKSETERVATLEAENEKVDAQNAEAQKAYEAEKAQVDAQNAEAQKAYEAEKAKVEKENADKLTQYEAEKAKVEKENADRLKQYEAEKAKVEKENADKLAQYEAEKAKVEKENADKLVQYEAEKAKVLALRDQLTKDYETKKAQVDAENAQLSQSAKDSDKAYQDALKTYETQLATFKQEYETKLADYNAQLAQITKFNQDVDASNAKVKADYEAKKAQIEAANQTALKNYQEALAVYEQGTTVTKEKVLDMDLKAPEGVIVNPKQVIEKDLTGSTNLEADLKAAEDEFQQSEARVKAQLDAATNSIANPVDTTTAGFMREQTAKIRKLVDAQNEAGQHANIRYVIKPKRVTGATKESLQKTYDKIVAQLEAEKLTATKQEVPAYEATPAYSYYQVESKVPFLSAWASLVTNGKRTPFEAVGEAAQRGRTLEMVPLDITKVDGYDAVLGAFVAGGKDMTDAIETWKSNAMNELTKQLRALQSENGKAATLTPGSDAYNKALETYNQQVSTLEQDVARYNDARKKSIDAIVQMDIMRKVAQDNVAMMNKHHLDFHTSSDKVRFLDMPPVKISTEAYVYGFDIYNPNLHETENNQPKTMTLGDSADDVQYTAVRIPKGESVTVRYRRNDETPYLSSTQRDTDSRFVLANLYNKQGQFTTQDAQDVTQIEYTITNDGSVNEGGDLVVFVVNDIRKPFYYGVSTQAHDLGTHNFTAIGEHGKLVQVTQKMRFLNKAGDALMPVLPHLQYQYTNKKDPNTLSVGFNNILEKGTLPPFTTAPVNEYVVPGGSSSGQDNFDAFQGTIMGDGLKPVQDVPNLETTWKDTHEWRTQQTGWNQDTFTLTRSSYNKPQLDVAMDTRNRYRMSYAETGTTSLSTSKEFTQPTKPTFGATYKTPQLTGELVRTIELPDVHAYLSPLPPITPVKMVIKYKEVTRGEKPTPPLVAELPKAPEMKEHRPLPVKPEPMPAPEKPTKPAVDGTPKPLPKEPELPTVPQKPVEKPLPEKPNLSEVPNKPVTPGLPVKPEFKAVPKAPEPKPTPKAPEKNTRVIEKKVIEKPQPKELPKKPEIHIVRKHYIYQPKTIWETVDGKVLRNWEDGEKPKDGFDGYEYVRTDKDKDGNIHHIYKPIEKPQEQPKMKTIWETVSGKVLRSWEDGDKPKDNFNGYEYVRTDKDNDGNIHHVYQPVEKPQEQPKMKTIWETVDGKVLRSWEDGEKPKDNFDGYEYVRTDKDNDGNIHHVYQPVEKPQEQPKMKTIWETVDGKVLRSWEDGDKPKDNFDGYEYVRTDKDNDGNIHHIYKPIEKPQEQPKMKTIWETVDGKVLRSWEDGEKPKDNFNGYEYVRTDKDNDGNIHHIYKPIEKPKVTPKETPKELPKTGGDSGMLSNMLGGIFTMGGLLGFKRRKDKNK